jgi:probable phosphoglycerate mutase
MPARLYLIRHGDTEWSTSGRHTGTTDIPLTAVGEARAGALADLLRPLHFDRVLVSPRQRARRTCELAGLGAGARVEPDLAEWDYGAYEGKTTAEILAGRPGWSIFQDGCPNGEVPEQVAARADRLLDRLRPLPGLTALFSHGHFGRVLGVRWMGLPVVDGVRLLLEPATVSLLSHEHDNPDLPVIGPWNLRPGLLP